MARIMRQRENAAATKLQATQRRRLARNVTTSRRKSKENKVRAASKLQAAHRRRLAERNARTGILGALQNKFSRLYRRLY
jgi:hypothetical protein